MPRHEGGHEQLSYKRAEEQADQAVDRGSKGQTELWCKAVEHRLGHLTTTTSILGDILGRNYRAQQIRAAFDPVMRSPQASSVIGSDPLKTRCMMHEPARDGSYEAGNKWRFFDRYLARWPKWWGLGESPERLI